MSNEHTSWPTQVAHKLVAAQNRLVLQVLLFPKWNKADSLKYTRVGTSYGGWWVPKAILDDELMEKVVISAGLGHDVSFDEGVANAGFKIIGLDPLSECISLASKVLARFGNQITLIESGLWSSTGRIKFFAPKVKTHDSWSATNAHGVTADQYLEYKVTNLSDLKSQYESLLNPGFVMLKMDIEGSEVEVLKNIIKNRHYFDFLAAELDFLSLIPFKDVKRRLSGIREGRRILSELEKLGYEYQFNEGFNCYWLNNGYFGSRH